MRHPVRLLLVMLLSLGLVAPRVSAVLGSALGLQTVVLCDGQGLTTITLGRDGTPSGIAGHEPCALLHVLAAATAPGPDGWQPAALPFAFAQAGAAQHAAAPALPPRARGPPAA